MSVDRVDIELHKELSHTLFGGGAIDRMSEKLVNFLVRTNDRGTLIPRILVKGLWP
jgi:hypothetical protein